MSTITRNGSTISKTILRNKVTVDFTRIGGLDDHIALLRETIAYPLLYSDVYSYFGVQPARGVLFHGPPGTGKTLVAGALANELTKERQGKVHFYSQKGADILDKWVGESEKKLRDLFDKAMKHRPSIIFFDELDGLAPTRSHRNDHVHCSIVATLLALMDGLNNTPGVVVIGATNRLDSIDPALRRPGRFDKELYFAIPCTAARIEILKVHIQTWSHRPSPEFLAYLAELTTGFTGSDLQALCSEAFLCSIKREYPHINNKRNGSKIVINKHRLKVEECDFLTAKFNITPSTQRTPGRMRKLAPCVRPLLQRQLNKILFQILTVWPHFTITGYKYCMDVERYIARLLLIGSNDQGLNNHIVPALLQALEHLPVEIFDISVLDEKVVPFQQTIASILLFSRVHNWWDLINEVHRNTLITFLEDLHPSRPILIICTSDCIVPETLYNYFSHNSAVVMHLENPTKEERENFFKPLFFNDSYLSLEKVLQNTRSKLLLKNVKHEDIGELNASRIRNAKNYRRKKSLTPSNPAGVTDADKPGTDSTECIMFNKRYRSSSRESCVAHSNFCKKCRTLNKGTCVRCNLSVTQKLSSIINDPASFCDNINSNSKINQNIYNHIKKNLKQRHRRFKMKSLYNDLHSERSMPKGLENFSTILTDLVNKQSSVCNNNFEDPQILLRTMIKKELDDPSVVNNTNYPYNDVTDEDKLTIQHLFERTIQITSDNWTERQLELLYDAFFSCLRINNDNFENLKQDMDDILSRHERTENVIL